LPARVAKSLPIRFVTSVTGEAYMRQRFPDPLDPDGVARAIVAIVSDDHRSSTAFDLTAGAWSQRPNLR
jgi:hypothetical protein